MGKRFIALLITFLVYLASGCAGQTQLLTALKDDSSGVQSTQAAAQELLASDPDGPIPEPQLPEALKKAAATYSAPLPPGTGQPVVAYAVTATAPEAPELAEKFESITILNQLQDVPLHTIAGLEQRVRQGLEEAENVLHSYGYYDGKVEAELLDPGGKVLAPDTSLAELLAESAAQGEAGPAESTEPRRTPQITVKFSFIPGPLYHMGKTVVAAVDPDNVTGKPTADKLPANLAEVGLPEGAPAQAQPVLDAVQAVQNAYRNNGYPFAEIAGTRFVLDREAKLLEADVSVRAGIFARMGDMDIQGQANRVRPSYLENLRTWEVGEPWSQDKIEAFRNALRATGLFQSIDLAPAAQTGPDGLTPVLTTLESALERTVGGALKYDTSFGVGVQGFWEHRNFTGRGDSLRTELSVWQDMQELIAKYRLPFAFSKDQDFIAQAGAIRQDTDAYEIEAGRVAAGIERRLSEHWSLTAQGTAEGGRIKDPAEPRRTYVMLGLPAGLTYSSVNSVLDATRGSRLALSAAPYTGYYNDDFNVLRSRLDLQHFQPLLGEDAVVLALRASLGGLWGATAQNVPPTVRFYSGGGGSVRGYEYQSLGPRNKDDKPLGGDYLLEFTMEPRFKITEEWGFVAFLDGGTVYETGDDFGRDLRFGAGVGLRYYTVIGPVRFDVATPLNPREDDPKLQFYISIGQSF